MNAYDVKLVVCREGCVVELALNVYAPNRQAASDAAFTFAAELGLSGVEYEINQRPAFGCPDKEE